MYNHTWRPMASHMEIGKIGELLRIVFFFFSGIGLSHGSNIGNLNPSDHCILINLKTIRLSNNSANSISWKTR